MVDYLPGRPLFRGRKVRKVSYTRMIAVFTWTGEAKILEAREMQTVKSPTLGHMSRVVSFKDQETYISLRRQWAKTGTVTYFM